MCSHQIEPRKAILIFNTTEIDKKHIFLVKKKFSQQNVPHTAVLSFSAVLIHFYRNDKKLDI